MAKEKEQKQKAVTLTANNVVEEAKKGNILTTELKERMDKEIQDEKDKQIVYEVKRRHSKIGYILGMSLVHKRKMNRYNDLSTYNVRQLGRLERFLCGFTVTDQIINEFARTEDDVLGLEVLDEKKNVLKIKIVKEDGKTREEKEFKVGDVVPAVIDFSEFDKGTAKLEENLKKKRQEIEDLHKDDAKVIAQAAGEYYSTDWTYNLRIVTMDGLDRSHPVY